jgi:hypothetical protein
MSVFSSHGTIRQEDVYACNVARSAIARSLALEVRHTELLVTDTIARNQADTLPIAVLWMRIQSNSNLRSIAGKTDAHVDAYSQFATWVKAVRSRLAYAQKSRLTAAFGPRINAHRFRNGDRLTRLHLLASSVPL